MIHVALTCPRLLFTMGVNVWPRPGRIVDPSTVERAIEKLGGSVRRGKAGRWFAVELADSVDAINAWPALRLDEWEDAEVQSIVGSAAAMDLVLADPTAIAASAATWLRELVTLKPPRDTIELTLDDDDRPIDFSRGVAAARHFTRLAAHPVPAPISQQQLPDAPLVLWSVADASVIAIHGPQREGDLEFEPVHAGWRLRSSAPFSINGRRGEIEELAPGMVIQRARPTAFVVLAVR